MNPKHTNTPQRKFKFTALVLFAAAIFLLLTAPWGNTTSYHRLLLFLLFICILLHALNLRKLHIQQWEQAQKAADSAVKQQDFIAI